MVFNGCKNKTALDLPVDLAYESNGLWKNDSFS